MLRRYSADLPRQPGAADGVDLVGVDLGPQSVPFPGLQDPPGLLCRKHSRFAEHIAEFRQLFRRYPGDHLLADQGDICLPVLFIRLGQSMSPHKGGHKVDGVALIQGPDGPQLLALLLRGEAVAAFRLAGGSTKAEHLVQGCRRLVRQFLLRGGPGSRHRRENTPALGQDVQIGHPVELQRQLVLPPAAKHQMGVGVHQPRRHQTAAGIQNGAACSLRRAGTQCGDDAVLDPQPGVTEKLDLPLGPPSLGGTAHRGGQKADVHHQQIAHE